MVLLSAKTQDLEFAYIQQVIVFQTPGINAFHLLLKCLQTLDVSLLQNEIVFNPKTMQFGENWSWHLIIWQDPSAVK